jgi:hypothetical protein
LVCLGVRSMPKQTNNPSELRKFLYIEEYVV